MKGSKRLTSLYIIALIGWFFVVVVGFDLLETIMITINKMITKPKKAIPTMFSILASGP